MSNQNDKKLPKGAIISKLTCTSSLNPETAEFDPAGLLILPTRNLMLFPGVSTPITIGREVSQKIAREAASKHFPIGIFCQKNPEIENPGIEDVFDYGTVAEILDIVKLPDGNQVAIANAFYKVKITGEGVSELIPNALAVRAESCNEDKSGMTPAMERYFQKRLSEISFKIIEEHNPERVAEFKFTYQNLNDFYLQVSYLCTNLPLEVKERYELLKCGTFLERVELLAQYLEEYESLLNISEQIKERAREQIGNQQRQAFLSNQMEAIRSELYGDDDDASELMTKAQKKRFPDAVMEHFTKEVKKLERLNPQSPDYSVLQSYLETLLSIPWGKSETLPRTIKQAEKILNKDHFGLEKVKERILEQLAMIIYNPEGHAPIICLVGPPGVGKTSLGESVAEALGREYQRISLGGMHDESEIRGHRRTYIGAMPGRIIDAMKRCKKTNPVLLLDEIDKMGNDYKGDPSAALLEVLDPEQNKTFHDNYVDVDYDLSDVLFICTANTVSTIPAPLLDRMEIIELPGYLLEEKVEIAKRHLIPRALSNTNMKGSVKFQKDAIVKIIENYTSESGVRQLNKEISSVLRKHLLKYMRSGASSPAPATMTSDKIAEYLGTEKYVRESYDKNLVAGVVPGLAWTQVGGEMLYIEALLVPGKGDRLTLTGNLGDVMKESANIAWQLVRANAADLGIDKDTLSGYDVHIHAPEGAVPKDGPSAGITIATAITSAYLGKSINPGIAMTGEITLTGKVLPVGGIREKILAAKRVGINTIILSSENKRNLNDIPEEYRKGMTFRLVERFSDVVRETGLKKS